MNGARYVSALQPLPRVIEPSCRLETMAIGQGLEPRSTQRAYIKRGCVTDDDINLSRFIGGEFSHHDGAVVMLCGTVRRVTLSEDDEGELILKVGLELPRECTSDGAIRAPFGTKRGEDGLPVWSSERLTAYRLVDHERVIMLMPYDTCEVFTLWTPGGKKAELDALRTDRSDRNPSGS